MNQIVKRGNRLPGWEMFGDFDDVVNQLFRGGVASNSQTEQALTPAIDVSETSEVYTVRAELPGIKKEDLDVSINEGILTINAESRFEHEDKEKGRVIRQERRYGKYVRSMRLGGEVDEDNVVADYSDGVLTLTLPKADKVKPKKIAVNVN